MNLHHLHVTRTSNSGKHEPLRTYEECAEALGVSVGKLNALRRKTVAAFPAAVFKHHQTLSIGKRTYFRMSEVRAWKLLSDTEQQAKLALSRPYIRAGLLAELVGESL